MSRTSLSNEDMILVAQHWLRADSVAHAVLIEHPELAMLEPKIKAVCSLLQSINSPERRPTSAESEKAAELDGEHDRIVRGLYGALTSIVELSADDMTASLRDWLFPDGLLHTSASYEAEAGHAARIANELTKERKLQLRAIVLGERTALDYVSAWLVVSSELGQVTQSKADIVQPSCAAEARNAWYRLVRSIETTAELLDLDHTDRHSLLGALEATEHGVRKATSLSGAGMSSRASTN